MKVYFAVAPFSAAVRAWNAELARAVRNARHEVFLPQEREPGKDAAGIFATDVAGIDRADALVAIMNGADPDSGTSRDVGYAYRKTPVLLVRTDFRSEAGVGAPYNPMLTQSATIRLEGPFAPTSRVVAEVLDALLRLDE